MEKKLLLIPRNELFLFFVIIIFQKLRNSCKGFVGNLAK